VLDLDPDLLKHVEPELAARLRRQVLAEVMTLEPGEWRPHAPAEPILGLLVLDGLLSKSATIDGRNGIELFGQGDILRPEAGDAGDPGSVTFDVSWTVLDDTWVAVLDAEFQQIAARCPGLMTGVIDRVLHRTSVAHSRALAQMPALDQRLLIVLWQLADRWGHVESGGVSLPLQISQTALGHLVGAQRQSVSRALGTLLRSGTVQRRESDFLLRGMPPGAESTLVGAALAA
jgi:CRP-like cAMP-binding protein